MWSKNILNKRSSALSSSLMGLRLMALKQNNSFIYGTLPCASFAKYDRSKPHLNVGTIGKYLHPIGEPEL
jgi:hypothetical protein